MEQQRPYDLLAVSDLHLGCDLRGGTPRGGDPRRDLLDRALCRFLDHHALRREGGRRWRLLLVGDVFDFVAVTQTPAPGLTAPFEVAEEERSFGLASEEAKCAWKVTKVAARHEEVFHALARFLVAGHELHFIRGNHDAELHWPAVQAELRRLVCKRTGLEGDGLQAVAERIVFHAWFYLEPGFLYAEHGNAHDRYCLQSGFFDELPGAPELELPMSSKAVRYFVNRWAKAQEELDNADKMSITEFLRWTAKMGNPLLITLDFVLMLYRVIQPVALQSLRLSKMAARLARRTVGRLEPEAREQQRLGNVERWLARYADDSGEQARQLFALASRPAEQSLFDAVQLFFLDRMLLALVCLGALVWGVASAPGLQKLPWVAGACFAFGVANALLGRLRHTDAHPLLFTAARRVAQVFGVRYVVMGHSHRRVDEAVGPGQHYLNLGSWEPIDGRLPYLKVVGRTAELGWFEARSQGRVPSAAPAGEPGYVAA